jgi:hypothetical protein
MEGFAGGCKLPVQACTGWQVAPVRTGRQGGYDFGHLAQSMMALSVVEGRITRAVFSGSVW